MKFLIVGLGNVGAQYELTRHNIGFLVLDRLADRLGASFSLDRHAMVSQASFKGRTLGLVKPTTFMNASGKAVRYWMQQWNIPASQVLVITDDIALPFGKLRLRPKGSHGGHNGLRDIEAVLGSPEFARLRFGVGSDFPKGRQADYVLSPFPKAEMDVIIEPIDRSVEGIMQFCTLGVEQTMTWLNQG